MSKERSKTIDFIYYNTYTIISHRYTSLKRILKISVKYTYTYTSLKRVLKISVKNQDSKIPYTIIYYNIYIIISYTYVEEEIDFVYYNTYTFYIYIHI